MLPFLLVLLIAQGVFAAPSIVADLYQYDGSTQPDNGELVNSYITDGTLAYIDGGDTPVYAQILLPIINDLANVRSPRLQAAAVLQTIASTSELAYGIPGDSCASAGVINAYVRAKRTGDNSGLRSAVANYIGHIAHYIDDIVQVVINPNGVRGAFGPRGNCFGKGRSYQFEEAWEAISESSSRAEAEYLDLEYCASKRLYSGSNIRSNNIAASVTAASIEPVLKIAQKAIVPLAQFLRAVAKGSVPEITRAAEIAKSALNKYV